MPEPQVLVRLREMIDAGEYPSQSRLPSERALAERLGVSRSVMRHAFAELEAEGKLWRHVGRGTFVGTRPPHPVESLSLITKNTNPNEVMEVRLAFEPEVAALAALRATSMDVAQMERCIRRSEAAADIAAYEQWDGALHRTITQSVGNNFMMAIFDAVNAVRRSRIWGRLKEQTLNAERQDVYTEQHKGIVDSIADRNARQAEARMRVHLETVRGDLFKHRP